ncbi:hypothetical protein [Kitasatospora cathayae]|uniref:Uncharacterized protein n=1 Tax=Kitasatospora cathayae TaxID=3004092 RepID=A0ABY7Q3B8_9ACTN|nr:hypothetical protein [Kitasatospora sp. HUAS 3-15]WBP87104.1 hypothetical protein O1G21_15465 [Kitasatospora sp. HUAS 3-15]
MRTAPHRPRAPGPRPGARTGASRSPHHRQPLDEPRPPGQLFAGRASRDRASPIDRFTRSSSSTARPIRAAHRDFIRLCIGPGGGEGVAECLSRSGRWSVTLYIGDMTGWTAHPITIHQP